MTTAPASRQGPDAGLAEWRDVWVYVELEHGRVQPVAWELLGEGRKLADGLGSRLAGVVLGPPGSATAHACAEAFAYGADLVYLIEDPVLADYRNEPYARGVERLVRRYKPDIFLLGASALGRDLAGSVATLLGTGLTADCTALTIDAESGCLAADRPTFGGSLLCTIQILDYRPQMATVRPRVMATPPRHDARNGEIVRETLAIAEEDIATKVLEFLPDAESEAARLPFADIVVTGGRGLGNPGNLKLVFELAETLGAEVGATRPLVTAGWLPAERQVGQTGKTVRPKLYIAAGVSGAVQHRVGMENADVILAINTDPNATIFDFATYGVVADATVLLPELRAALLARLEGSDAGTPPGAAP